LQLTLYCPPVGCRAHSTAYQISTQSANAWLSYSLPMTRQIFRVHFFAGGGVWCDKKISLDLYNDFRKHSVWCYAIMLMVL